jgi:RNA polymerase sigma-70 factor (ECF subfamily)
MAQDFAQDALLKILDNLDSFRGESKFTTWASKIAARVAISELRRARYKSFSLEHLTASGDILPAITAPSGAPDGGPAPEHFVERQEVLRIVEAAFRAVLTERQQTALRAVVIEGMPVEEVARQMGSNRNALYKLIHDARLKLKRHMEAQGLSLEYILELFEGT